jgi:hypothetical protein
VIAERVPKAPSFSAEAVTGRRFRSTRKEDGTALVVGDTGVSLVADAEKRVTVRWSDTVAVLRFDDGGRVLFGADALAIDVQPQAWRDFAALRDEIDRRTPPSVVVPMGEAPERPPAPLPRSRVIGTVPTSLVAALAVAVAPLVVLMAFTTAIAFALVGLPMLALVAWCGRELVLRARKRRAPVTAAVRVRGRPMRHTATRNVQFVLAVSCVLAVVGMIAHVPVVAIAFAISARYAIAELRKR